MNEEKYFNFPIQLLEGFMENPDKVFKDIWDYSVYSLTLNYEYGDEEEKIKSAKKFLGIKGGDDGETYHNGEQLHDSIPLNSPKVGLNTSIYFNFFKNHKSDFEKACLLGFLGIKSILLDKSYCKITNEFWISRMDGKKSTVEQNKLSSEIRKYNNNYQLRKIKEALQLDWGLKEYSHYTRGFYVSFKLDQVKLALEVERRKDARRKEKLKEEKKLARLLAFEELKKK